RANDEADAEPPPVTASRLRGLSLPKGIEAVAPENITRSRRSFFPIAVVLLIALVVVSAFYFNAARTGWIGGARTTRPTPTALPNLGSATDQGTTLTVTGITLDALGTEITMVTDNDQEVVLIHNAVLLSDGQGHSVTPMQGTGTVLGDTSATSHRSTATDALF